MMAASDLASQPPDNVLLPTTLIERMWRWFGPVAPARGAPQQARDFYSRGLLLRDLCVPLLVAALLSVAFDGGAEDLMPAHLILVATVCAALLLNRRGWFPLAVVMLMLGLDGALVYAAVLAPDALLLLATLFVVPQVVGGVLMHPHVALVATIMNSCLGFTGLYLVGVADGAGALVPSSQMAAAWLVQIFMSTVLYVRGVRFASESARADQAEQILAMEQRELARKRELEEGIRQLLAVKVAVANGHLDARVPVVHGTTLFPLCVSLNTLLGRLQGACNEVATTRAQVVQLRSAIEAMQHGAVPQWPRHAGTPLDDLITDLQTSWYSAKTPPLPIDRAGRARPLTNPSGPVRRQAPDSQPVAASSTMPRPVVPAASAPKPPLPSLPASEGFDEPAPALW